MIGTTVGHYRILEKIGQGGMGEVYRAEDTTLRRNVALKFLPRHLQEDTLARRRLLREAESAAALEHPYICNIKEVSRTENGQDFIVMEYVEGQTVKDRLQVEGPLPLDEALRIGTEVAEALEMAHEKKIVHRDLKPSNIMLTPQGHAKVMDFGLAKRVASDGGAEQDLTSGITGEGSTPGTPAYMSPEQLEMRPVDSRSDLFSLGIVLYEMMTGTHPFLRSSSFGTMAAILHEAPEPLTRYLPDSPESLQETVTELLSKDPDRRTQTAGELKHRLTELAMGHEEIRLTTFVRSRLGRRLALGVATALVTVFSGLLMIQGAGGPVVDSVAVLPFRNLSGDPEQDYFAEGVTDAVTNALSKIGALRVTSQSGVKRYENTDVSLSEIARELGVEGLVDGSVVREGDLVRVSAQLIDPEAGTNVWAESFERNITTVLALYGEVARAIAGEIRVTLTPEEEARITQAREVDPEAYDAYLKGSYHWKKLTPEGFRAAEQYLDLALEKDPSYAPAHAELAWVWSSRQSMSLISPQEAAPRVREAALRAIALDTGSAKAHEALAQSRTFTDWDWAGADPEWQKTLELDPNAATAHAFYAHFLAITGRSAEAVRHSERALQLDPFNALFHGLYAVVLCFERRYDEAIDAAESAMSLQPRLTVARSARQYAYIVKGMREELLALQRLRIAADPERVAAFERGLAEGGYEGAQRAIADILAERYRDGPARGAKGIALRYLGAGDYERAVDWLEEAYENREQTLPYIGGNPVWDPLRSDPRFQELLRKMNVPDRLVDQPRPASGQRYPGSPISSKAARTSSFVGRIL